MQRNRSSNPSNVYATTDIQLGDVIFFCIANDTSNEPAHVAICVGHDQGVPKIAHATRTSNVKHGVKTSYLSIGNELSYLVFRVKDQALATQVANVAADWSDYEKHHIPHDLHRRNDMENFINEVKENAENAVKKSQQYYQEQGFWRAIKFAIRRNSPFSENSTRGFRCDQFVIICFQVAELLLHSRYKKSIFPLKKNKRYRPCLY